jgi:hypothetical protein
METCYKDLFLALKQNERTSVIQSEERTKRRRSGTGF